MLRGRHDDLRHDREKSFIDETLATAALASGSVVYQITAVRSTLKGAPGTFLVRFGVGGGREVTATVVTGTPKLAA